MIQSQNPGIGAAGLIGGVGWLSLPLTPGRRTRPAQGLPPKAGITSGDGSFPMQSLGILIDTVIWIFTWVLIINIALGWLIHFNILNPRQQFVRMLGEVTYRITEPALRPIRRYLPAVGGLDLSPIVLILLLQFARNLMWEYVIY